VHADTPRILTGTKSDEDVALDCEIQQQHWCAKTMKDQEVLEVECKPYLPSPACFDTSNTVCRNPRLLLDENPLFRGALTKEEAERLRRKESRRSDETTKKRRAPIDPELQAEEFAT